MANTIVTLNEVIKLMSNFVEGHPQLNDFGYGMTSEIGTSKQMTFPYLWATHDTDSNMGISTNKTITPELSFTLLFVDQLNQQGNYEDINGENSDNGQEILSDCFQYAQDFLATSVGYWSQYGISLNEDASAFPIQDETDDKVNGWGLRITLNLKYYNCVGQIGAIIPVTPPAGVTYVTCETISGCTYIQDIVSEIAAISGLTCDTLVDCPVIQTIQTDITNIEADIIAISGATGGLTCDTLSACTTIQTIQTDITNLSGDVVTNTTNIATLSAATQTFYIAVNYLTTDTFEYVAPEQFKINSVSNPDALTITIEVNASAYTLGDTISLYDDVTVATSGLGFIKLNSEIV